MRESHRTTGRLLQEDDVEPVRLRREVERARLDSARRDGRDCRAEPTYPALFERRATMRVASGCLSIQATQIRPSGAAARAGSEKPRSDGLAGLSGYERCGSLRTRRAARRAHGRASDSRRSRPRTRRRRGARERFASSDCGVEHTRRVLASPGTSCSSPGAGSAAPSARPSPESIRCAIVPARLSPAEAAPDHPHRVRRDQPRCSGARSTPPAGRGDRSDGGVPLRPRWTSDRRAGPRLERGAVGRRRDARRP